MKQIKFNADSSWVDDNWKKLEALGTVEMSDESNDMYILKLKSDSMLKKATALIGKNNIKENKCETFDEYIK